MKYTAFSADGGPSNESRNFLLSVFNPGRTGSFGPLHAAGTMSKEPGAVSYTHLDVYKRQISRCKSRVEKFHFYFGEFKILKNSLFTFTIYLAKIKKQLRIKGEEFHEANAKRGP